MRILFLTSLYSTPAQPSRSPPNARIVHAMKRHARVRVVAPLPYYPAALARGRRDIEEIVNVPSAELDIDGEEVLHPRYAHIPKLGRALYPSLYAASLLACLHAFGSSLDFWTLLALNIGISLIASLVPVPGGGTAVSAIGLSGMMVALGVPTAAATAAILAHQVAVSYLPAIPGWFASNDLIRKRLL